MSDRSTPSSPTFPCTQVGLVRRGFAKRFARFAVGTFVTAIALTFATWLLPDPSHWHIARVT